MKKKELRGHLGMLAFSMDSQWCVMHREDLPEPLANEKCTKAQILMCFDANENKNWQTRFD